MGEQQWCESGQQCQAQCLSSTLEKTRQNYRAAASQTDLLTALAQNTQMQTTNRCGLELHNTTNNWRTKMNQDAAPLLFQPQHQCRLVGQG